MILDLAFKWVWHLFRSWHLFPSVHLSRVEWQMPVTLFMSSLVWLEASTFIKCMDSTHWQNQINASCRKITNVINMLQMINCSNIQRRIYISREILRKSLFSLSYGTILTSIKFDNFGTQCLNEPRHLFYSFCCTTQHIFEPKRGMSPWTNTVHYQICT